MKNTLGAAALLITSANFAFAQDLDLECFDLENLQVTSSPGNPLFGTGSLQNGTIGGKFGNSGPDGLSGQFSIGVIWDAPDGENIPWTASGNSIQFASGGNTLAFGNLDVQINDFDNDRIKKVEFTVSVCLDDESLVRVESLLKANRGAQLFLVTADGAIKTEFADRDTAINLSDNNLLTEFTSLRGRDGFQSVDTASFSYEVRDVNGETIRTEDPLTFDTHLGFEVCACVPEPSSAMLSVLALAGFVTRRKR